MGVLASIRGGYVAKFGGFQIVTPATQASPDISLNQETKSVASAAPEKQPLTLD